ncbi:MAG: hypothetical protein ACRBEQ_05120 [Hyphomonas sp.]
MSAAEGNDMPGEVVALENAFRAVPGIYDVSVGKNILTADDIQAIDKLSFGGVYADLPIAMLRRSKGNLENEILINVEFRIEKNVNGLKALEFLSWHVRDSSRSGENLQIRSIGLPPQGNEHVQLGHTLRFWFEAYIVTESEEMSAVLVRISELAGDLNENFLSHKYLFET